MRSRCRASGPRTLLALVTSYARILWLTPVQWWSSRFGGRAETEKLLELPGIGFAVILAFGRRLPQGGGLTGACPGIVVYSHRRV